MATFSSNPAQNFVNQMASYAGGNTSPSAKFVADQYPYSAGGPLEPGSQYNPSPTGTGTGSGGTNYDQNLISGYDQAINNTNSAISRIAGQKSSAISSTNSSYQDALNSLLLGKNQANSTYDTNVLSNKQDYVGGKNTVRSNAGSSLNGLLRLLGSRGAGGGSAATVTAPGAVAREASLQQADLGNTFGKNAQSLDTNWNNYLTGYNNQVSSATKQHDNALQGLNDTYSSQNASLLQTLAQLAAQKASATGGNPTAASQGYLDQANSLLNGVGNYQYTPISYQTQAYSAPDLSKYIVNANSKPTFQGQSNGTDYASPYLQALLGKKQPQTVTA